jgi:hypothetical protein
MNTVRSSTAYYIGAFLLGVLVAVLVAKPARGADCCDVRPIDSAHTAPAGVLFAPVHL